VAVEFVKLIIDWETGRLRGVGFVEMASGGDEAIAALHEQDFDGRNVMVNQAKPRQALRRQPRQW
jgi:RNA recognition motif-containing protein